MHIVELQRKLQEARNDEKIIHHPQNSSNSTTSSKYRLRTAAAVEKDEKDASELLELGVNPSEISDLLGISPREVARIEEDNKETEIPNDWKSRLYIFIRERDKQ